VGLVFQDGALFPHMNVAANIAFGMATADPGELENWLDRVGLSGLGTRYPHELSGGQQQRAALARAMAPGPEVLLMDEPFASVDIVLRRRLRRDCRMLLRAAGTTTVLVTHDPEEALDIGDKIAVMEEGRIVQFAAPQDLHENPAAASVGAIFGGAQVVRAVREGEDLRTAFGLWPIECVTGVMPDSVNIDLLISAERVELIPDSQGPAVRDVHPMGPASRVLLEADDGHEITAVTEQAVDPSACYRPVPQQGSVRAFART
jgi:iron(III) transport system ATP-binding protein